MKVTIVTVTYGDRQHLLTQTLDAAKAQGAAQAVVVDNGALVPVAGHLAARYAGWAQVCTLGANRGSAVGFTKGIEQAVAQGAELILLLDDDNIMQPGCLAQLCETFNNQLHETEISLLAVLGFRRDRHLHLAAQACGTAAPLRTRSTFRGFHLLDVPGKLTRRLGIAKPPVRDLPAVIRTGWGPYGGLMFHSALVARLGLPQAAFVLYEDDTEFTYRITKSGGVILLVTGALIEDAERSWSVEATRKNSVSVWLDGEPAFRAYYAFRNGVYCDLYCRQKNYLILYLNMMIYMLMLITLALFKRRFGRAKLLLRACLSGMSGALGLWPGMPLGGVQAGLDETTLIAKAP